MSGDEFHVIPLRTLDNLARLSQVWVTMTLIECRHPTTPTGHNDRDPRTKASLHHLRRNHVRMARILPDHRDRAGMVVGVERDAMNTLTPAQQAYRERLDAIEAEKLAALNAPSANADQIRITAIRRMSAAYVKLKAAELEAQHQ